MLYEQYKVGILKAPPYMEQTVFQQSFFNIGAAEDIVYKQNLDVKLTALCEAAGVKFKK